MLFQSLTVARRAKTELISISTQRKKYLIAKVVFLRFCGHLFTTLIFATNQTLNATNAKITYLCNRFGLLGQCFCGTLQNLCFPQFVFLFQCLTHTEKALNVPLFAAPRKRARTGFYYLCFIYQLFTYHVKRWRGLFGARCGLLSPRDLSPDTHRPSFFYMRTGTYYGLLKIAVIFTTSPKWHCKGTNLFGMHQTFIQKSLYF